MVCARQLRKAGFAGEVAAVLRRTGLAPERLTVEITETAVFDGGAALDEFARDYGARGNHHTR